MAKKTEKPGKIANYTNPPIYEVVFGVRFEMLEKWKSPHAGLFWRRIFNDFPRCQHASPLSPVASDEQGLPFPRIWLINEDDDRLIQLQPDRFLYNWRHREGVGDYPHFEEISSTFYYYFDLFKSFCNEHNFDISNILDFELTYINHIYEEERWKFPDDVGDVIWPLNWSERDHVFLPKPENVNWQAIFSLPQSAGQLSVKLSPATRASDEQKVLLLELSAHGRPKGVALDDMKDWFSLAHEWIVRGFEDVTTEKAQREVWGKYD